MNNIYNNNYLKYIQQGYQTVPVLKKNPKCAGAGWQNKTYDFDQSVGDGIGLILGERSGVICLDLDILNKDLKIIIDKLVEEFAPSSIIRYGNRDKLPSRFYQYNNEFSTDKNSPIPRDKNGIQLLSSGKQVVLPPSPHENGYNFEWGETKLLDVPREFLPVLPNGAWEKLCEAFDKFYKEITVDKLDQETDISDRGEFSKHGSHNTLKAMSCAMIAELTPTNEAVNKLINKDKEINHDCMSFFEDNKYGKAWHTDIHRNAKRFYYELLRSINDTRIRQKLDPQLPTDVPLIDIKDVSFKAIIKERKKYPHFRGIGQEMFEYIYDQSPIPRSRMAMASVISTASIVLGNRVQCEGVFPNLYSLIIAPSGFGKDYPLKFPKKLLAAAGHYDLIGQSHPASDTGIMLTLPEQPVRIDCIDEADIFFGAISSKQNSYATKMGDVYATLYTSTGDYFEGKTIASHRGNVVGACHSPYISILAAMTPNAFERSFTTEIIEKGLGARFLYFLDTKRKRSRPHVPKKDIPKNLINYVKRWRELDVTGDIVIQEGQISRPVVPGISLTKAAEQELIAAHSYIEDMKDKAADGRMMAILNRLYVNIIKLAILDCSFVNPFKTTLTMDKDSVIWSLGFFGVYTTEMRDLIESSVSDNQEERDALKILNSIKDSGKDGITASKLFRKTKTIASQRRRVIIKDMTESGLITEAQLKAEGSGRPKKIYFYTES